MLLPASKKLLTLTNMYQAFFLMAALACMTRTFSYNQRVISASSISRFTKRRTSETLNSKIILHMGLLDGLKNMVGVPDPTKSLLQENDKQLKTYMQQVEKINDLEAEIEKLSNDQLRTKTDEFRQRLRQGNTLDSILVEAFAIVREASWRVLELRHYDVQLIGGMNLLTY